MNFDAQFVFSLVEYITDGDYEPQEIERIAMMTASMPDEFDFRNIGEELRSMENSFGCTILELMLEYKVKKALELVREEYKDDDFELIDVRAYNDSYIIQIDFCYGMEIDIPLELEDTVEDIKDKIMKEEIIADVIRGYPN